jgi:predicted ATPase
VLFEALLDAVEESARGDETTLWILDDVHWADDATWHFIHYAARRVADMNLMALLLRKSWKFQMARRCRGLPHGFAR